MDLVCRCANTLPEAEAIIRLFEGIANSEGWQPGDQLGAHSGRSIYFGAFHANRLVGGLQLVASDQEGRFPSHMVWPEIPLADNGTPTLYAAVLAVLPEFRGRNGAAAFWSLGIALWRHCVENGVKAVYLEATPKMLRCYRLLGWPLEVIGELREHWGEPCYPCRLSVRDVAGSLAERSLRSTTYRGIFTAAIQPVVIVTTAA